MNKIIIKNYILITFLVSWTFFVIAKFVPENIQMLLLFLGAFGPFISVLISLRMNGDKESVATFKKQILKWKAPIIWYLFPILIVIISQSLDAIGQIALGSFEFNYSGIKKLYMIIPMILLMLIGGGQEEIGWRGLLLPELLKKYSPIISSLFVGITWALWHIPLFFIEGLPQYGQNFISFSLGCISLSLFMTFLYRKTKSTLISGYWFHMVANGITGFFNIYLLKEQYSYIEWPYYILIGLLIIIGIFLNRTESGCKLNNVSY